MLTFLRSERSWRTSLGAPRAGRPHGDLAFRLGRLALVLPLVALVAGCTAPGDVDNADNNVIFNIEAIRAETTTGEVAHAFGDIVTGGSFVDDTVEVELSAVLKAPVSTNPSVTRPDLQNIALERYEVTYERTDGGTSVPPGFTRGIAGLVRLSDPGTEEVVVTTLTGLVIVPGTSKAQAPLVFLVNPGFEPDTNFSNIQVTARIQFFGKTLAGHDVTVVGHIGINFADYGDIDS